MKLKETDDMRAPLAFLLGRLDFDKDFKNFTQTSLDRMTVIKAEPKSDKLPYKQVEFAINPAGQINRLNVTGQDGSSLQFLFSNEKLNPAFDDTMFKFLMPAGASMMETQ